MTVQLSFDLQPTLASQLDDAIWMKRLYRHRHWDEKIAKLNLAILSASMAQANAFEAKRTHSSNLSQHGGHGEG